MPPEDVAIPAAEPATPDPKEATPQPGAGGAAQTGDSAAVDTSPEWARYLETAPTDELKKHPKIAGLVGDLADKAWRKKQAEHDDAARSRAQAEAEAALERLADEDPEAFAARFKSDKERERAIRQFQSLRNDTRAEFANAVGSAYRDAPGWDDVDHAKLMQAVAGKPDDEVIVAFHKEAMRQLTEINSKKSAKALYEEWREKELPKEREALRKEIAAEMLKKEPKPGLTRGKAAGVSNDWASIPIGPEYDRWYEKNVLKR